MASNFSAWLRETARLYLRYAAVGLIGIPLALLYAGARHADWNLYAVGVTVTLLGLVGAFMVWRWVENWQTPSSKVPVNTSDVTSDAWAELLNAAARTTVKHQQIALCFRESVGAHQQENLKALNLLFTSVLDSAEKLPTPLSLSFEAVLKDLATQAAEIEQVEYKESARAEALRQREPAWTLALRRPTQNAHGLA